MAISDSSVSAAGSATPFDACMTPVESSMETVCSPLACRSSDTGFTVSLPRAWLEEHPLTEAALDVEAEAWRAIGIRFDVRGVSDERVKALG